MAEIERFKAVLASHFVCFDPGEVDEFALHTLALKAMEEGRTLIERAGPRGRLR